MSIRQMQRALISLLALIVVAISCLAPITLYAPLAHAQGESPSMTEEAGEEAAGEGSSEDSGGSSSDVPPEAQDEVDEASRGDPAAQESVGSNANEEEQQPTAPDGTPLPEQAADAVEEGSRGDSPAQGSVSGDGAEPNTGGEDSGGKDATSGGEETGGIGKTIFIGLLKWIWGKSFGWFVEQVQNVGDAFLHLPDPTESSEIVDVYTQARNTMMPLIAAVILAAAGAMMLAAYNKGISHAAQTVAPRVIGVTITLAVLPFLFSTLSTLSTDLTAMVLPDRGAIWDAQKELMKATLGNLALTNILNVILMILGVIVVLLVTVTAFLKNIFFSFLFVASAFALIGGLIPQLWNFAVTWWKAVLVCAVISPLWALEIWVGSQFIKAPEMVLGQSRNDLAFLTDSMLTTTIAIIVMWIMYKTPFKVLSWAFVSYDGSSGVGLRSFGRFMLYQAAATGLKQVAGAAAAAKGSGDEAPAKISESRRQTTRHWQDADGNDQSSTSVEETQNVSRTRDASQEEADDMLAANPGGSGSGSENSNLTGAGGPPSSSDVYSGASGDHSSGGIRAARPGISGEVLEDQPDLGQGNSDSSVTPKNPPGGFRMRKIIPAQVGEQGGPPPRHPDAGYDDDDSAVYHDGERYRWRP